MTSDLYALLSKWHTSGKITDGELYTIDRDARVLMDVCGGCEKIRNTLMSSSWYLLMRQCIALYLLVLPWGLIDSLEWFTIPVSVLVAYLIISGEFIAHYVERPFGKTEDHLDLDSICQGIENSVNDIRTYQVGTPRPDEHAEDVELSTASPAI